MRLEIKITEEILEKSAFCGTVSQLTYKNAKTLGSVENCAIAWAIKDVLPNARVCITAILLVDNECETLAVINLPDEASSFIPIFDRSTPSERTKLKPFSFIIEIPEDVLDLISIEDIHKSEYVNLV